LARTLPSLARRDGRRRPLHAPVDSVPRLLRPRAGNARGRKLAYGPRRRRSRRDSGALRLMERPLTANIRPGDAPPDIDAYERAGGYQAVRRALQEMSPEDVLGVVTQSGLRGRGGAGFPTGQKWSFMPRGEDAPTPRYLIANADEMEPGTFKDRLLLEGDPHLLIEGMIVSAYAL